MYVYNTEKLDEVTINEILGSNLAVDLLGDKEFLLSKENEILLKDKSKQHDFSLEEYIKDMYDGGECVVLNCAHDCGRIGINEAIYHLVDRLYKNNKRESTSYAERIYQSEDPNKEILSIIDECVIIELDERIKLLNKIKKQLKNDGIQWK